MKRKTETKLVIVELDELKDLIRDQIVVNVTASVDMTMRKLVRNGVIPEVSLKDDVKPK